VLIIRQYSKKLALFNQHHSNKKKRIDEKFVIIILSFFIIPRGKTIFRSKTMIKSKLTVLLLSVSMSMFPIVSSASAVAATGQYIKASTITADVKAHLLADPDVKSLHISVVTTKAGVVHLSGYVQTDDQKQKAVTIASQVDGVKSVDDKKLKVKPEKK
jgi:hyperosmotically inducible periplasmic protein